jgi:hypothetical protein
MDDFEQFLFRWKRRLLMQKLCFAAAPFVIGFAVLAFMAAVHQVANNVNQAWGLPVGICSLVVLLLHLILISRGKGIHEIERERQALNNVVKARFAEESRMLEDAHALRSKTRGASQGPRPGPL